MFYSQRLSILAWVKYWGGALFASLSCYAMLWGAYPPRQGPEFAYFFLFPVLIWFYFSPSLRKTLACLLLAGWIYQIAMVGWMRHVSFGGMVTATFLLSCYNSVWFLFARAWYAYFINGSFSLRLLTIVGLSALWVVIEWGRTLFTLGFPWCPLSASQWQRPVLLQTAYLGGAWTVSFFLVFFNLCLGSYLHHLLVRRKRANGFFNRSVCPELYLGLLLLFFMVYPYFQKREIMMDNDFKVVRIGICQPYLKDKWLEGRAKLHKETLRKQTEFLSIMQPDVIVWPEASTPYPINLDPLWVEKLAKKTGVPIIAGSVVREEESSYNVMAYIDPVSGLNPEWYAKQILVPFGEYVPWPFHWIPGLEKFVGAVGNFSEGDRAHVFDIPIGDGNSTSSVRTGLLICYEDIFPALSRTAVSQGAELLIVSTNDAWFEEEGCAQQHAAHSVMRAVENNLPIVRCGNAGWSGWIDGNGIIRDVLKDQNDNIYFEGAKVMEVRVPRKDSSMQYSMGGRFAYFCTFFFIAIALYFRFSKPKDSLN